MPADRKLLRRNDLSADGPYRSPYRHRTRLVPLASQSAQRMGLPESPDRPCRASRPCRHPALAGPSSSASLATIASVVIEEAGHAGRALKSIPHHLGGIDHALPDEVAVLAGRGVEAEGIIVLVRYLSHRRRRPRRVLGHLGAAPGARGHAWRRRLLVVIGGVQPVEDLQAANERHAAAGQDALFDRCAKLRSAHRRRDPSSPSPPSRSRRRP